jgi:tetratricopeptide (TPR) repeat protein
MNKIGWVLLGFFVVLAPGLSEARTPDPYLDFAIHLLDEGDYYRAITEAKRFLFLHPDSPRRYEAWMTIGRAEYQSGRYQQAFTAFAQATTQKDNPDRAAEALIQAGMAREKSGSPEAAEEFYQGVIHSTELPRGKSFDLRNRARFRLGWMNMEAGNYAAARKWFEAVDARHQLHVSARNLAERSLEGDSLPRRSPATAGFMSAVLPGAGQLYAGRPVDAGLAFGLNAAFLWGTIEAYNNESWAVFALLGLMEVGWYGGNIYNAVNGAHIYNREKREEYMKDIRRDYGWRVGYSPREDALVVSWDIRY